MNPRATALLAISLGSMLALACGAGPSEEDLRRSQRSYELAATMVDEGNLPSAFDQLFQAIRLDPNNHDAHFLLGNLYLVRGNHEEAEQHLRRVLAIRGRDPEARNSLGVLYIHMHRYDDAIRELRLATRDIRYRTPWLAWGNLGWALTERGRYRDAIEALLQSVRNQPSFCVGFYRLGDAYFRAHQLERADEALTRAVETDDPACHRLQDAWLLRGRVRLQTGEGSAAQADWQRCVEIAQRSEVGLQCQRLLDRSQESAPPEAEPEEASPGA